MDLFREIKCGLVVTDVAGYFGSESGVDECIERIAESINYAHSQVEKVVTGDCFSPF